MSDQAPEHMDKVEPSQPIHPDEAFHGSEGRSKGADVVMTTLPMPIAEPAPMPIDVAPAGDGAPAQSGPVDTTSPTSPAE